MNVPAIRYTGPLSGLLAAIRAALPSTASAK